MEKKKSVAMKKYYFLFFVINLVLAFTNAYMDEGRNALPSGFFEYLTIFIFALVFSLVPIGISYLISRFWKRKPIFTAALTFAICYVLPVGVIAIMNAVC